jgi:cell division protein ZapA
VAEVKIYINGRNYDISCDSGQEGRVVDLAAFIDQKLQQISRSGAAYNDAHLMVLTALVLADELFDTRETVTAPKPARGAVSSASGKEDELAVARVLEHLTQRIDSIATRIQQAS